MRDRRDRQKELMLFDLALTQAIELYRDMEEGEAYLAISQEWPEQTATLLNDFLFPSVCEGCHHAQRLIEVEREDGDGIYIGALCYCLFGNHHD